MGVNDAGGRRTQSTDQDGFTVNYQYDAVGRVTRISETPFSNNHPWSLSTAYDVAGRVTKEVSTFEADKSSQEFGYDRAPLFTNWDPLSGPGYDAGGRLEHDATWAYKYDHEGDRVARWGAVLSPLQELVDRQPDVPCDLSQQDRRDIAPAMNRDRRAAAIGVSELLMRASLARLCKTEAFLNGNDFSRLENRDVAHVSSR